MSDYSFTEEKEKNLKNAHCCISSEEYLLVFFTTGKSGARVVYLVIADE